MLKNAIQRLKKIQKELRHNDEHEGWHSIVWQWERIQERRESRERSNAMSQIFVELEDSYHKGILTKRRLDLIFTMVHQLLIERNIYDSDWDMRMPDVLD